MKHSSKNHVISGEKSVTDSYKLVLNTMSWSYSISVWL